MTYLIDTNVISELRKGARCDPHVFRWYAGVGEEELFLSALVLGEIAKGADLLRSREPGKARAIDRWLGEVERAFVGRILSIDVRVAMEWGRMSALRVVPVIDGLLAATAKVHSHILVTRNVKDVAGLGAGVLNPFEIEPRDR